ncbi:MAG TPA: Spy/CpxP family protein refolding chaperone [Thermodesulfobacteriota bacterium]|jgi:Spy/CpxP family protein refolding chaperone
MKRFILFSIVPLVLFAFSAYGYQHGKGHGKWLWWKDPSIVEELKLDDKQKTEIDEISSTYKGKLEEMRPGVDEKRKAFKQAMGNPDSTRDEITKAYDEMWDTKHRMKKVMLEMKLDIRGVLTPDQITKLNQIKEQHKQEMIQKHKKQ